MKKLLNGIIEFRNNIRPGYRETFAKLALGQKPDALLITCSDSRVAPNLFASTDPGDLFVVRNVGNLVSPRSDEHGHSTAAAIEYAIKNLAVKTIVICGHSECGAMQALVDGRENVTLPNLREWLRHGDDSLLELKQDDWFAPSLPFHNRLSQLNVLKQMEHLESNPLAKEAIAAKKLQVQSWWFDITTATVHCFDPNSGSFVELDEKQAERINDSLN